MFTYDQNKPLLSDIRGGMVGQTIQSIPTLAQYDSDNAGGYGGTYGDVFNLYHPLGMADDNLMKRQEDNTKVFLNAYASIEPIKGLKYKINITPDFQFYRYNNHTEEYDLV